MVQKLEDFPEKIAFSPNGKLLASVTSYGPVKLWDANSGLLTQMFKSRLVGTRSVAFSSDSETLALASYWDNKVELLDIQSGAATRRFQVDCDIQTISFSKDGTILHTNRGSLSTAFLSDDIE